LMQIRDMPILTLVAGFGFSLLLLLLLYQMLESPTQFF